MYISRRDAKCLVVRSVNPFEFYSLRFTTSVFYEGEDMLAEYYGIPRVSVNEGEDSLL